MSVLATLKLKVNKYKVILNLLKTLENTRKIYNQSLYLFIDISCVFG